MTEKDELTNAYKLVYKDLMDENTSPSLFKGRYDAKHGSPSFMNGICTVIERIAYRSSEKDYNEFLKMFTKNMIESERKENEKRRIK